MNELVIPDPTTEIVVKGWAESVLETADQIESIEHLDNGRAMLAGYVAAYKAKGKERNEVQEAERYLEVRIGELLGPAPGQGARTDLTSVGQLKLPADRAFEFRRLAKWRERVIGQIQAGTRGRQALLKMCAAWEANESAKREHEVFHEDNNLPMPSSECSTCNPDQDSTVTYSVIYADPPWSYEHVETPDARQIENQYTTLEVDDICNLSAEVHADENSVLFLWATNPKLPEALAVMKAWGFEYRTNAVWVKDRIGMGYYVRGQHELLLIGKRGDLPIVAASNRPSSVIQSPRTEHSAKPVEVYDMIEAMYPGYSYRELFARGQRDGWSVWGHGVGKE